MRQSDGSEILGPNDPRNIVIGIIHVTAGDDRQSVLTAITTQEKLGRDQIILELPAQNKAFRTSVDFEGLHQMSNELEASLVLILPQRSKIANFAAKQGFKIFNSLDALVESEFPPLEPDSSELFPQTVPSVEVDEADHTLIFPISLLEAASSPAASLPVTPQFAPNREDETTAKQVGTPNMPALSFPSTSAGNMSQLKDEDEEPTHSSLEAVRAPSQEDKEPANPSFVAVSTPPQVGGQAGQLRPSDRLPVPLPATGGAPVPSSAQPPAFYEPREAPRHRSWKGLIITGIILLVLIGLGILLNRSILDLLFLPTATVTITPDNQQFQRTYQITAVLGTPDPTKDQVGARALYASSQTQTRTVKATGQGRTSGQQAQGVLTFYNTSPNSLTVPAGTVIFDDNGLAVVNNDAVTLPGFDPSKSIVSVDDNAHSISVGNNQNISANDFHNTPCCGAGISVTNNDAFTGGQDAQLFTYVQQSDIDSVTQSLEATQALQATSTLQKQIRSNEMLEGAPRCVPLVNATHQAGEQASTLMVSVTTTCMDDVYNVQAVQMLATGKLTQDAGQSLNSSYVSVGQILANVTQTTSDKHGTILLTVNAQGVWAYQFTTAQRVQLARLIAGKSSQDARALLLKQSGVSSVTITLTGVGMTVVPDDTSRITVSISAVQGLRS